MKRSILQTFLFDLFHDGELLIVYSQWDCGSPISSMPETVFFDEHFHILFFLILYYTL